MRAFFAGWEALIFFKTLLAESNSVSASRYSVAPAVGGAIEPLRRAVHGLGDPFGSPPRRLGDLRGCGQHIGDRFCCCWIRLKAMVIAGDDFSA